MEILIGSIVKFENGYYRVSGDQGNGSERKFNLKSVFNQDLQQRDIPYLQVTEAREEFLEFLQNSY
jgi:hypothetical protein